MSAERIIQTRRVNNRESEILKFTFGPEVGNVLIEEIDIVSRVAKIGIISDTEIEVGDFGKEQPGSLRWLGHFIESAAHVWQRHTGLHWKGRNEGDADYHYTQLTSLNLNSAEHSKTVADWFRAAWGSRYNLLGTGSNQLPADVVWDETLGVLGFDKEERKLFTYSHKLSIIEKAYSRVLDEIRDPALLLDKPIGQNPKFVQSIGRVSGLEADALRFTFGPEVGGFLIDKIYIKLDPRIRGGRIENGKNRTEMLLNPDYDPKRLKWLEIFIHEATHLWQRNTGRHQHGVGGKDYVYDETELSSIIDLNKEQHAKAVQHWFSAAWGSRYNLLGDRHNQLNAGYAWGNPLRILGYKDNQIAKMPLSEKLSKIGKAYAGVLDEIRDPVHLLPKVPWLGPNFPDPAA